MCVQLWGTVMAVSMAMHGQNTTVTAATAQLLSCLPAQHVSTCSKPTAASLLAAASGRGTSAYARLLSWNQVRLRSSRRSSSTLAAGGTDCMCCSTACSWQDSRCRSCCLHTGSRQQACKHGNPQHILSTAQDTFCMQDAGHSLLFGIAHLKHPDATSFGAC